MLTKIVKGIVQMIYNQEIQKIFNKISHIEKSDQINENILNELSTIKNYLKSLDTQLLYMIDDGR